LRTRNSFLDAKNLNSTRVRKLNQARPDSPHFHFRETATLRGKLGRIDFWIARTAYNTSLQYGCPYLIKSKFLHGFTLQLWSLLPDGTYWQSSIPHTLKLGPGNVPDVCHVQARFLVIAAPRPSGYQTWMNPGGTNRGALFLWSDVHVAQTFA
jgi:hypothetical protein